METRMTPQKDVGGSRAAKVGKALGLVGLALGAPSVIAPRHVARLVGLDDSTRRARTVRLAGIASMIGGAVVVAVAVHALRRAFGAPVRQAITVGRSRDEIYAFWRKLERLPEFMKWVESVEQREDNISHWTVKTVGDVTLEYDAEIIEDVPGRVIRWRSLPNATVPVRGTVEFLDAPGDRGTEVVIEMQVAAPLGKTIASKQIAGDLHRLKQILELGEIVQSDASIHKGKHPAQPTKAGIQ